MTKPNTDRLVTDRNDGHDVHPWYLRVAALIGVISSLLLSILWEWARGGQNSNRVLVQVNYDTPRIVRTALAMSECSCFAIGHRCNGRRWVTAKSLRRYCSRSRRACPKIRVLSILNSNSWRQLIGRPWGACQGISHDIVVVVVVIVTVDMQMWAPFLRPRSSFFSTAFVIAVITYAKPRAIVRAMATTTASPKRLTRTTLSVGLYVAGVCARKSEAGTEKDWW